MCGEKNKTAAGWNETKGIIRFTPMAEDRGKRLTCRAKNVNISRVTEAGIVVLEPPGQYSSGYAPEHYKEDGRHLVIYGIMIFFYSSSIYTILYTVHAQYV